jgi:hypothetical protein
MKKTNFPIKIISLFSLLILTLVMSVKQSYTLPVQDSDGTIDPAWRCGLQSNDLSCDSLSSDVNGHIPSPVLADMDGDNVLDIIIATRDGRVIAISHNGSANYGTKLFDVDIAPAFGMAANSQKIEASPAVADIDRDGRPEVVIGTGQGGTNCYKGGIIVLEHNGNVKPNWPQLTSDFEIGPKGCSDPIYSSPALGDLDNDGDLEIVTASFDKRIYAWHHDGTLVAGFPPDSKHLARFGWPILEERLADTIWGSPALADMDGDGYLDIIIGTDEGNFDETWSGDAEGWVCPYAPPPTDPWIPGYCGGTVYGLNRFGQPLPGFPIKTLEIIQSTPAIYDVNADGKPEVFMGTGTWYLINSPDQPTFGFRIFGWDHAGKDLPGWEGGKVVGGATPATPAVGDIDGDGEAEIVALAMDKKLYAWHYDGSKVSGFPMVPRDQTNSSYEYNVSRGLILADYTGDGAMEIFLTTGWSVTIVNGEGDQLTTTSNPPNADFYFAKGTLRNVPAVGDVDGDGELELVASNSNLYVWDLPGSGESDWPMFKQNAARTAFAALPLLRASLNTPTIVSDVDAPITTQLQMRIRNAGYDNMHWTASSNANWVTLSPNSGNSTNEVDIVTLTVKTAGLDVGTHQATITVNGGNALGSPRQLTITARVVRDLQQAYLPFSSSP